MYIYYMCVFVYVFISIDVYITPTVIKLLLL